MMHIKNFLFLVLFIAGFVLPLHTAYAQDGAANSTPAEISRSISKGDIQGLIDTLEDPQEREKFIKNLNTLVESSEDGSNSDNESVEDNEKSGSTLNPISDVLNVNEQTEELMSELDQFLIEHGLNASYVGKTLSTIGIFFIFWIFSFLVLKLSRRLRDIILPTAEKYYINTDRLRLYNRFVRYFFYGLIALLFIYLNAIVWELTQFEFLDNSFFSGLIGNVLTILFVTFIALTLWEIINGFMEYLMQSVANRYSNRVQTLLPIVRNVVFFAFSILFTLVLLSEIGVDIVPLLAGAGVVGIAVGFGAQTMVKDFLTGFIIILEDLIQVGDVASVGGKTGLIEKITIRKVQMRDLDGTVYTVPFSEISVVSNLTKHFSYYLMDVGIAYRENPDEVIGYMKEIDEELRADEDFKDLILEPIHILGVDQFADSAVVIKARIKTLPIKQWDVGREYNRRMKHKFDEMGIEIPFPHQTVYFGEDKKGKAPPAYVRVGKIDDDESEEQSAEQKKKSKSAEKKGKKNAKKESKTTGITSTDDEEAEAER